MAEDIDVQRAREAKERAEKRLSSNDTDVDVARAQAALARANCRLQVAEGSPASASK
jgi:F-type H+-transporting ATPase subunit epsilon